MKIKQRKSTLRLAVVLFAAIGSGVSIYLVSTAIFGKPDFELFRGSPNGGPTLPPSYPDYHFERTLLLHKKIEQMKKYLDSLSLYDSSRYREILRCNPKLTQNIQSIESLFNQLIKK